MGERASEEDYDCILGCSVVAVFSTLVVFRCGWQQETVLGVLENLEAMLLLLYLLVERGDCM